MHFTLACSLAIWVLFGMALTKAHQLQKRADDTNPLEVVVDRMAREVSALQAELQAMKTFLGKKAAFHSRLNSQTPPPNAPIHMTPVHEVGNGYDVTSGMYIAPYSGWYSVDFQLFPKESPDPYFDVDLFQNGDIVARARCDDVDTQVTCHSGVTLHVSAGEKLWIQCDHCHMFYTSQFDNLFTVVLVQPDE